MRINKFVAQATGLSRRRADVILSVNRVHINGNLAHPGDDVKPTDSVTLDNEPINLPESATTIMLNKPVNYVVSRRGQGSQTIYDLLPPEYQQLKPIGRLDKNSSGLLLLTNDGELANELTHPRYAKTKIYDIELYKPLAPLHQQMITDHGLMLEDGNSKLQLESLNNTRTQWRITMHEGRNRQIRRTFASLMYEVKTLHRISFGTYQLIGLRPGETKIVP